MKLEEGNSYIFTTEKVLAFESEDYFVLKGPDQRSYLLKKIEYETYDLVPGKQVSCRVDKINCKGEIFLEPVHPYYQENQSYSFKVISFDERVDKSGEKKEVLIVLDKYGNEVVVPRTYFENGLPSSGEYVKLLVKQIVKGSILVYEREKEKKDTKVEESRLYSFRYCKETLGIDGKTYILAENEEGEEYLLPREYYKHYGLEPGKMFLGRYIRYKEGHEISVEPDNPYFETGEKYKFIIKEIVKISEGVDPLMILLDSYGFSHKVHATDKVKTGDTVWYRVEKMRKGWPQLIEV